MQAAISWKKQMEAEVEEGRARLRRLEEELEVQDVHVPDLGSEIANLKAKLAEVEEERDTLRSTACKRQARVPSRPDTSTRRVPMMPMMSGELDEWMCDRQAELQEAVSLQDCSKVLELTSMLSDAAVRMMEMSGRMVP